MCIKWSRILQKSYDKHKFCYMVAFRSVTRVRTEFKPISDLSMGHGWLLRPYCLLLAEFWQSHDPHPIQQNYICPGCGCCCAQLWMCCSCTRALWVVSRDACAGSAAAWAGNLSLPTSGLSTRGSTSTARAPQPGWTFSLGSCPGWSKQILRKSPGSELEPGIPFVPGGWWFFLCCLQSCILPFPLPVNCQAQAQSAPSPL